MTASGYHATTSYVASLRRNSYSSSSCCCFHNTTHARLQAAIMAEGSASLDAEDYAVLGLGTSFADEGNSRDTGACTGNSNACAEAPEVVHASKNARSSVGDAQIGASDRPAKTGAKRRGRPKGYRLSKPTKRKGTGFIGLTGVPPQPPILKNQLGSTLYKDNSRRFRTDRPNCSKYTGVYYEAKQLKWKAQIMVEGKV